MSQKIVLKKNQGPKLVEYTRGNVHERYGVVGNYQNNTKQKSSFNFTKNKKLIIQIILDKTLLKIRRIKELSK